MENKDSVKILQIDSNLPYSKPKRKKQTDPYLNEKITDNIYGDIQ
jgi:hypothetical protein